MVKAIRYRLSAQKLSLPAPGYQSTALAVNRQPNVYHNKIKFKV